MCSGTSIKGAGSSTRGASTAALETRGPKCPRSAAPTAFLRSSSVNGRIKTGTREPAGASASPTTIEGSVTPRAKISCATWIPASVAPTPMRTTDAPAEERTASSTLRAETISHSSIMFNAAPRDASSVIATTRMVLAPVGEGVVDRDHRRSEKDHEQRWEDAREQREDNLDRNFLRFLFRALTPLHTHLVRLDVKHLGDRDTEDVGLDHREHERLQLGDGRPLSEVTKRIGPALTDLHLLQHAVKLFTERPARLARHTRDRRIEPKACLHRDGQQVERVGKGATHQVL